MAAVPTICVWQHRWTAQDDSATTFKLADGVTIADERELRQLVRPEEWCSHERMRTGMMELNHIGLAKHERLAALSAERFKMAAEQLSPPEVTSQLITYPNMCEPNKACTAP